MKMHPPDHQKGEMKELDGLYICLQWENKLKRYKMLKYQALPHPAIMIVSVNFLSICNFFGL